MFLYPPANVSRHPATETGGERMANPSEGTPALPFSRSPVEQVSSALSANPPPAVHYRRRVIEVCTQSTQDQSEDSVVVALQDAEITTPATSADAAAATPQSKGPPPLRLNHREVQENHCGTGVHVLDFTGGANPRIRELATPTSHYARRQRGPEVAAEGLILQNPESAKDYGPGSNVDLQAWAAMQTPAEAGAPSSEGEPCATSGQAVGNFVAGGFLRTVPEEGSVESPPN